MDDQRVGAALRALRLRRGLRQVDVARAAGLAHSTISLVERGHLGHLSITSVRAAFAVVDARFEPVVFWRGGALDRLLDERHARLAEWTVTWLRAAGWRVEVEVTFSHFGERGSIDLLAWHAATRTLLVVEIKTELVSSEDTLRRLDVKVRLAPDIGLDRFDERAVSVARLVVLGDTPANRRRVQRAAVLEVALPDRGWRLRSWLRTPAGAIAGLWMPRESRRLVQLVSRSNPRGARDNSRIARGGGRGRSPGG